MTEASATQDNPAAVDKADVKPDRKPRAARTRAASTQPVQQSGTASSSPAAAVPLSTKAILAAINDGDDTDPKLIDALQAALYRFGAQDPSMGLARSWQRVQRRIDVDPDKLDGIATGEQVAVFADRTGLAVTK